MVKRIIWTNRTDVTFTKILEFYIERNGSKTFSRNLNNDIQALLRVISKQPLIGIKKDKVGFRVLIRGNYKIFYEIAETKILIHMIWDCRQNPEDIQL